MADVKITDLTLGSTPLAGTELFEMVQGGTSLKITAQDIANLSVRTVKVTLSSAEILQLFTTPKTLVAAQGSGKIINLISVTANLNYNSTTYGTNTDLQFAIGTGWGGIITMTGFLGSSSNSIKISPITAVSGDPANISNRSLRVICPSGNPITGNSTVDIYVTYNVITL